MQTRRRFLGAAALGLFGGALPLAARAQGLETAKIIEIGRASCRERV